MILMFVLWSRSLRGCYLANRWLNPTSNGGFGWTPTLFIWMSYTVTMLWKLLHMVIFCCDSIIPLKFCDWNWWLQWSCNSPPLIYISRHPEDRVKLVPVTTWIQLGLMSQKYFNTALDKIHTDTAIENIPKQNTSHTTTLQHKYKGVTKKKLSLHTYHYYVF